MGGGGGGRESATSSIAPVTRDSQSHVTDDVPALWGLQEVGQALHAQQERVCLQEVVSAAIPAHLQLWP